jgi:hypothetical protein
VASTHTSPVHGGQFLVIFLLSNKMDHCMHLQNLVKVTIFAQAIPPTISHVRCMFDFVLYWVLQHRVSVLLARK